MADEPVTESAKAVQETAKATATAIVALQATGAFFNRVFGDLVEDGVGIVADRVRFMRQNQAIKLAQKTEEFLRKSGVEETAAVQPKVGVPLIEYASLEDNEELHTIWAKLLANAMDPNTAHQVNRIHISLLKELEPLDARILFDIAQEKQSKFPKVEMGDVHFEKAKIVAGLGIEDKVAELSLLNLMRLGCITPGIVKPGVKFGGHSATSYKGTEFVHLSELGRSLVIAVQRQ